MLHRPRYVLSSHVQTTGESVSTVTTLFDVAFGSSAKALDVLTSPPNLVGMEGSVLRAIVSASTGSVN